MSREKYFRHGKLKEWVLNPKTQEATHLFPADAVQSIRCIARAFGFHVKTKRAQNDHRWVMLRPVGGTKP